MKNGRKRDTLGLICPVCGEDDIVMGSGIGSRMLDEQECYKVYKRAFCRSCSAKLIHITVFRECREEGSLIPREQMKAESGTGFGIFKGRWA